MARPQMNGLSIEDTDQERFVEGALDLIYKTMKETGLEHDEGPDKDGGYGPYVQSERMKTGMYLEYAKQLVEKGEAYYCFCTKERLEGLHKEAEERGEAAAKYDKHCLHLSKEEVEEKLAAGVPYVIRQNNPTEGETSFNLPVISFSIFSVSSIFFITSIPCITLPNAAYLLSND